MELSCRMTYPSDPGYSGNAPVPGGHPEQQQPYPAYGQQQAFPPGPPTHRSPSDKTNGLAVASLITGLIGCVSLVGLILGIIALGQIRKRGERGRGMAIAGIVLFCVWTVLGVVGLALNKGSTPSAGGAPPTPTRTAPQKIDVRKMRVGQCIDDDATGAVDSVKMVPCDQPHDMEVLANGTLRGLLLPSDEQIRQQARLLCRRLVGARIARDPAADVLSITNYHPSANGWRHGDHSVTCLASHATDGKKLTRPIRGG